MAASSSSQVKSFHVFPSFHGPDVRKGFLSHLHSLFASKGIKMFKDHEIERGHTIRRELINGIRESRVTIVLLSKNYASSRWCLDELVETLKWKEVQGQIVMPIFYDVEPSDVLRQEGDFGMAFEKTCEGETEEQKRKWRDALTFVANIEGEDSHNWTDEAAMVEKLATDVLSKLNAALSRDSEEKIKEAFRGYDVDHNGFISAAELRYAMTKDGGKVTNEEAEEIIRKADDDGDGRLSYDEFLKLMMAKSKATDEEVKVFATDVTLSSEQEKEMMEFFTALDVDKNGFITVAEFQYVMRNSGTKVTDKGAYKIIREGDVDGDGRISYDELVKLMMARRAGAEVAKVEKVATYVCNKINRFVKWLKKP